MNNLLKKGPHMRSNSVAYALIIWNLCNGQKERNPLQWIGFLALLVFERARSWSIEHGISIKWLERDKSHDNPNMETINVRLERARFCDLPVENPLWRTEILRYDAALGAHNLPAMERERDRDLSKFQRRALHWNLEGISCRCIHIRTSESVG